VHSQILIICACPCAGCCVCTQKRGTACVCSDDASSDAAHALTLSRSTLYAGFSLTRAALVLAQVPHGQPANRRYPGLARFVVKPPATVRAHALAVCACKKRGTACYEAAVCSHACSGAAHLLVQLLTLSYTVHRTRLRSALGGNRLTGTIPDSLGSLSNVEHLCAPVRWLCLMTARHNRRASCGGVLAQALLRLERSVTPSAGSCLRRCVLAQVPLCQPADGRNPGLAWVALKPSDSVRALALAVCACDNNRCQRATATTDACVLRLARMISDTLRPRALLQRHLREPAHGRDPGLVRLALKHLGTVRARYLVVCACETAGHGLTAVAAMRCRLRRSLLMRSAIGDIVRRFVLAHAT
jgi:hypothetical protein